MRQFVHVCGRCDALCDVHGGTVHVLRMVRDAANVVALPDVLYQVASRINYLSRGGRPQVWPPGMRLLTDFVKCVLTSH